LPTPGRMKSVAMFLLLLGSAWAQSPSITDAEKAYFPLVLTVTGARGTLDANRAARQVMGYLSDDRRHRSIPVTCHEPILISKADGAPERYPAAYPTSQRDFKIQLRPGTNGTGEHLCVF
jgi:hypothetical protein